MPRQLRNTPVTCPICGALHYSRRYCSAYCRGRAKNLKVQATDSGRKGYESKTFYVDGYKVTLGVFMHGDGVAELLGISREYVRQIEEGAMKKIVRKLAAYESGGHSATSQGSRSS